MNAGSSCCRGRCVALSLSLSVDFSVGRRPSIPRTPSSSVEVSSSLTLQHAQFRPPLDLNAILPTTTDARHTLDSPDKGPQLLATVLLGIDELLEVWGHDTVDPCLPSSFGVEQRNVLVFRVRPARLKRLREDRRGGEACVRECEQRCTRLQSTAVEMDDGYGQSLSHMVTASKNHAN